MAISYDPLWKTLKEKGISKTDLRIKVDFSTATLAKLGKNESVTLETIEKICTALDCDISSVVEIKKS